jgi:hypothetical protein
VQDVQQYADQFADAHGLPRVAISSETQPGAAGSFFLGELKVDPLVTTGDPVMLERTVFHEMTHNAQQALMVRHMADSIPGFDQLPPAEQITTLASKTFRAMHPDVEKLSFWEESSPTLVEAARTKLQAEGIEPTDENVVNRLIDEYANKDTTRSYIEDVLTRRNGQPLSDEQRAVAEQLFKSHEQLRMPAEQIAINSEMIRTADQALRDLSGPDGGRAAMRIIDDLIRNDQRSPFFKLLRHGYGDESDYSWYQRRTPDSAPWDGYREYLWEDQFISDAIMMRASKGEGWPVQDYVTENIRRNFIKLLQSRIDTLESDSRTLMRDYQEQLHEQEAWYAGTLVPATN